MAQSTLLLYENAHEPAKYKARLYYIILLQLLKQYEKEAFLQINIFCSKNQRKTGLLTPLQLLGHKPDALHRFTAVNRTPFWFTAPRVGRY